MMVTLLHSKMFHVGDLPALTFSNCVLKTGVIKWPLKLYIRFYVFFSKSKKHDFRFFELLHMFYRMLDMAMSCARTEEPIDMLLGVWTRVGRRNNEQVAAPDLLHPDEIYESLLRCGLSTIFFDLLLLLAKIRLIYRLCLSQSVTVVHCE